MFKMHCMIIACLLASVVAQRVSSYELVPFTKVAFATERRAVCMDGSPGGYYYSAGSGDGAKNWLIYLMGQKVQFRGSKIFDAVVEDLLVKGMAIGKNVILSGRSAGGLATILHCDNFRARLPIACRVKCLSDAGFFIRAENVPNADYREQFFASTIMLHKISRFLPATCTKRMDPNLRPISDDCCKIYVSLDSGCIHRFADEATSRHACVLYDYYIGMMADDLVRLCNSKI
ncbi:hypothetical protein SASPL_139417 [Salvia splendens]|uniref:Pectin acetylesterase n=1 Tax=Salvia splendens TaxID=180675 RepID=A0A8X8ZAZ3_SALSN|nr:hypothetical protein SASPL_139417 [Salvia splendens]